jgi:hypothetical protein
MSFVCQIPQAFDIWSMDNESFGLHMVDPSDADADGPWIVPAE